jgi:hypothetical protein
MHEVACLAGPVASPLEAGCAENFYQTDVHVTGGAVHIGLRVQVNSDAPAVGREISRALAAKPEAPAEACDFGLQAAGLNLAEHRDKRKNLQESRGRRQTRAADTIPPEPEFWVMEVSPVYDL